MITLTTDFGTTDHYVASLKGVMASINPGVMVVDVSHHIPAYDIKHGAFVLGACFDLFPKGTIHVGVVDPGVGSKRAAILVQTRDYWFVGPDNGLFSLIPAKQKIVAVYTLTNRQYFRAAVSHTFHGRDVFCPVAAHLSLGVSPQAMGTVRPGITTLPTFRKELSERRLSASIVYRDKFGNAFTNISKSEWEQVVGKRDFRLKIGRHQLTKLSLTYSEVPTGRPALVFGSSGFLELAMNQDNISKKWGLKDGIVVQVLVCS